MANYPPSVENLINCLSKLPGIGRRSAERILHYILSSSPDEAKALSEAISTVKQRVKFCKNCHNLSDSELCSICQDEHRDRSLICIVEESQALAAIERVGNFTGLYYVLGGLISPLEGRGPENLDLGRLLERVREDNIKEVIIATGSDNQGEATSLYLANTLKEFGIKISRIGIGLPVGSHLEYADQDTLAKALEGRREIT